jgi:GTP cyclohydrolase I
VDFDKDKVEQAVRLLLEGIGQDPTRDGLKETPARVARAYAEMLAGYAQSHEKILATDFEAEGYDEVVVLRNIAFYSICEHHLLPFHGTATIGYLPWKRVVGLSKLARLVECYAQRLQIQERMTVQISSAVKDVLQARGVGVVVRAQHLCMCARGVSKPGAEMLTTSLIGAFRTDGSTRDEFLKLAGV